MKARAVLGFGFALLLAPAAVRADPYDTWAKGVHADLQKSCTSLAAFATVIDENRMEFYRRIKKIPAAVLERRAEQEKGPDAFMELARVVWPAFLPKEFPGRMVFVSCGVRLNEHLRERTSATYSDYRVCVRGMDLDPTPLQSLVLKCTESK